MPPPVGYAEASLWFRLAGDPEEQAITIGINPDASFGPTYNGLAETVYDSFVGTDLLFSIAAISSTLSAVRCDVTISTDETPSVLQDSHSQVTAGTRTSSPPPSNCALFVRKTTGFLGRRYKGRMYFPAGFLIADQVSAIGAIDPSSGLPTLQTRANATYNALVENLVPPVLLHSVAPFTPTPIQTFAVQPVIATQRRRLRP